MPGPLGEPLAEVAPGVDVCVALDGDVLDLSLPGDSQTTSAGCVVTLGYLNEGGANVVYSVTRAKSASTEADAGADEEPDRLPETVYGKVIRIRKEQGPPEAGNTEEPTPYVSTAEVHRYFHTQIVPLVGAQHLLSHGLVKASPTVLSALNAALEAADASGARPKARRGSRLKEDEPFALVLADMRPELGTSFMLELKPKWLADSPTPLGLRKRRCRTCALRAMRAAKGKAGQAAGSAVPVCPLALGARGEQLRAVLTRIVDSSEIVGDPLWPAYGESVMERLAEDFTEGNGAAIVSRLKSEEEKLDPHGVLSLLKAEPENRAQEGERLGLAMTLRDCTMFIRMDWRTEGAMDIRLADLDQKDWQTRVTRWSDTEEKLIKGGWYEGSETSGSGPAQTDVCLLWSPD